MQNGEGTTTVSNDRESSNFELLIDHKIVGENNSDKLFLRICFDLKQV